MLAAVEAALASGDDDQALVHALAAWQSCRHPRIAAAIEKLSTRAAAERLPPKSKGSLEVKQNAWLAYATDRNPSDIDNLMTTLGNVSKPDLLVARLAMLKGRSDPRIAKAMHALLEDPPVSTAAGAAVLDAAMELLVAIADPRSAEAWSRLIRRIGARGGGPAIAAQRPRMPSVSTRLHAALDEVSKELTDEAILTAIEQRLVSPRASETEALFAAVYANPDDDRPRAVLADLLQELGDPRGELIALQLGGKRSKREKELLATHAHPWLGPIAPLVAKTGLDYARGFVDRCTLVDDRKLAHLVDRPEWRTITDLDVSAWRGDYAPFLANMPGLRKLRRVANPSVLPPHDRVEHVQTGVVSKVDELLPLVGFSALRSLHVEGCWYPFTDFEAFWKSPVIGRLTELSFVGGHDWMPIVLELGIRRIGYRGHPRNPWRLWFEGDVVTVEAVGKQDGHVSQLIGTLADVANRGLRVVFASKPPREVALDLDLRQALQAFAGVTIPE